MPEIWRYDGNQLEIYRLQADGYAAQPASQVLPRLTATEISRFLDVSQRMGENALIKQCRQWVRQYSLGS